MKAAPRRRFPSRYNLIVSTVAFSFLAATAGGCGSERKKFGGNGTNNGNESVDLTLSTPISNSSISIVASLINAAPGTSLTTVVGWEIEGTRRDTGGVEPITQNLQGGGLVSGIKTNPLVLNTLEYGLGKYRSFTVRGSFVTSAGTPHTVTESFNDVFVTEPGMVSLEGNVTASPLPDRSTFTLNPTLQALAGLVPPQVVNVKIEQVDAGGAVLEIANSKLGVGPINGQFTVSTTTRIRVTLTTPASGQSLIFAGPLVLEYTQLAVGSSETKVALPSSVGL